MKKVKFWKDNLLSSESLGKLLYKCNITKHEKTKMQKHNHSTLEIQIKRARILGLLPSSHLHMDQIEIN